MISDSSSSTSGYERRYFGESSTDEDRNEEQDHREPERSEEEKEVFVRRGFEKRSLYECPRASPAYEESDSPVKRPSRKRDGISRKLPIFLAVATLCGIPFVYAKYHLVSSDAASVDLQVFGVLWLGCFINYLLCMFVNPGGIPRAWNLEVVQSLRSEDPFWERGGRRICRQCVKFKPARAHHCKICKRCVLQMDHHCSWVGSCIGLRNRKYFFLLLFYAVLGLWWMVGTTFRNGQGFAAPSSTWSVFWTAYLVCLILFTCGMTLFFGFHIFIGVGWGLTTIEFCEKRRNGYVKVDKGILTNLRNILGSFPLFWLLPIPPVSGIVDGVSKKRPVRRVSERSDVP